MYTKKELEERFGFHRQTELTTRQHHAVRAAYLEFVRMLDRILPESPSRERAEVFYHLEVAAMWTHKTIAQTAPLAALPSEYKPITVDETLVDLLSHKIDMSSHISDGIITELDALALQEMTRAQSPDNS